MTKQGQDVGHRSADRESVGCAVITVSDTRTPATDESGQLICNLLAEAGHRVEQYRILQDEPALIVAALQTLPPDTAAVLINGGTGLARRDTTYETIHRLFDKEISGFGELFRMLSYQEIGAAAMLSRATAGVIGSRVIFSMPGAPRAVELAMRKLILPELGHVVGLVRGLGQKSKPE
ncbi:MAG: molybdenum cofactor biosynthesis protein B [Candidatus Binatia bacterium]|nr:MAG: molybdenum cofactor biosynthesis protein B [Candidatus Binatia bacterium]